MKAEERREGMVRRLLSTAVAAALLLGSVTGAVLGAETTQGMPTGAVSGADAAQGTAAETAVLPGTENAAAEAAVQWEEVSERSETGKVYRLSDGSYAAVDYGRAVHYLEDGEWRSYDNRLRYIEAAGNESGGYENTAGDMRVRFAPNTASGQLVRIETEAGSVRVSLPGAAKTRQVSVYAEPSAPADALAVEHLSAGVLYRDVLEDTDIEYRLEGGTLKENIVVRAPGSGSYSYTFELKLNGLTPTLEPDGSVKLTADKTGEVALVLPKGYMYDASGAASSDVAYTLTAGQGHRWLLTVTADSAWMNAPERAYPVTIDPTVVRTNHTVYSNIKDCYVYEDQTDVNGSWAWMYAGYTGGKAYHSLVGIRELPELPAGAVVIRATLGLRAIEVLGGPVTLSAHAVRGGWESGTAVWGTKPSFDATVLDYRTISANGAYSFDITPLAQDWYAGNEQSANGVLLRELTASTGNRVKFSTANNSNYNTAHPIFVVEYRDAKGLEGIWSYSTQTLGESGIGYVNRFNGNLVYTYADTTTDGSVLPVTVGHVYNAYQAGKRFTAASGAQTADFSAMNVGLGWKLSVQESVVERTISGALWLVYGDADGTEHYFYDFDSDGKYESEDGYGLTITRNTASTSARYTMHDDYGSSKTFNSTGRLVRIDDVHGNRKNLVWTNGRLTSITRTAAGASTSQPAVSFTYNAAGALTQISNAQNGDSITLLYSDTYNGAYSSAASNYLRSITRNGHQTHFSYYADGTLYSAGDDESYQYAVYTYTTRNAASATETRAVASAALSYDMMDTGRSVRFAYGERRTTETAPGNDGRIGTSDDLRTVYLFDYRGRPVCAYTSDSEEEIIYGATSAVYNNYPDGDRRNHTIQSDAVGGLAAVNLVKNGLLDSTSYWSGSVSGSYSSAADTARAFAGTGSLRITGSGSGSYSRTQSVYLTPGTYTFSAYLYLNNVRSVSTGGGAFLELDGEKSRVCTGTSDANVQDGWQRVYVTKTISAAGNYNVKLRLQNASGSVYFDCAQLESAPAPSGFNLVDNGGMTAQYRWGTSNGGSYVTDAARGNVMRVAGNTAGLSFSLQTIQLRLPAETSFTLSGWAKADSVPTAFDEGRTFRLVAQLKYSDGVYEEQSLDYNADVQEWQYGSVGIVPKRQGQGLTLEQVVIYLSYDRNANSAYFDDVSLKIEPAQLYAYDEDGNLTSNYNSDGNQTLVDYASNNVDIEEITNILGEKYEYTYKTVGGIDTHLVQTVRKTDASNNTLTLTYGYDSYGNTTSSTLTSTGSTGKITSGATYTDNGNRLSTVTDATGGTTSYAYNGYGQTSGVTDAKGVRIGFLYDTRRRLIGTYLDANKDAIANASEPAVRYAYDSEGHLQKIETDGTDYTFGYDHHGNVLTVKAGNYTLATNTYGPFDGALQTSTTGNGLKTTYEYDRLGRLAGVKENGAQLYSLTYNGDGQAARLVDNASGETTEYEYDGAGRLIRANRTSSSSGASLLSAENRYDAFGRAQSTTYLLPNQTQKYILSYKDKSSLLASIALPDPTETAALYYSYDAFERVAYTFLSSWDVPDVKTTYVYADRTNGTATYTSARIAQETLTANGSPALSYSYTYDANGNITEIKKNNSSYLLYEYDSLGQLTRESSYATLSYDRYAYDGSGNRVSKNTYYWSGTLKSSETYGYTNSTWGDLLTNYNGTTITYDASGNPKNWKDVQILSWRGNRMAYLYFDTPDAEKLTFEYNADGIRTKKEYADIAGEVPVYTDVYTVDGSKILSEQRTDEETGNVIRTIYYVYDANGLPVGMKYNGVQYWYQKNMQGDVVRILNSYGRVVAIYTYDAWGKNLQITDKDGNDVSGNPNHIANINPFRYRGYYYDTETGWYYLNARYYDPNVGRFLSPDTILGANGGLQGYNLFAYCNNNPVMFADPTGYALHRANTAFAILETDCSPLYFKNSSARFKNAESYIAYKELERRANAAELELDMFVSSDPIWDEVSISKSQAIIEQRNPENDWITSKAVGVATGAIERSAKLVPYAGIAITVVSTLKSFVDTWNEIDITAGTYDVYAVTFTNYSTSVIEKDGKKYINRTPVMTATVYFYVGGIGGVKNAFGPFLFY